MKRYANRHVVNFRTATQRLVQVHPLPENPRDMVSAASRLLAQFAAQQGKEAPGLSVDAADFLTRQQWLSSELARRIWRAVESNRGSLITAADLAEG